MKTTSHAHLNSELYHEVNGRRVSRYFPAYNMAERTEPSNNFRELIPDNGQHLYFRKRQLEMVVGSADELELEDHPSYGRVSEGNDTGWAYHGLAKMLFIPSLRTYVIDDHHHFYYTLCEARTLGLFHGKPWLYHFDLHHDMAGLSSPPPQPLSDLPAQARYTVEHLQIGNHISAVHEAGLCEGITWVTTPQQLAYKCSDMAGEPENLEILTWQDLRDVSVRPGAILSLDWDFLSALFNDGKPLSMVSSRAVDWFTAWWAGNHLHRDYAMLCVATSPGYTEETSLVPGVKRFLRALSYLAQPAHG
jgi:hypothetical protein